MSDGHRDELIRSLRDLPVAAILTDLHTHTFSAANDQAGAIFGVPANALVGSNVMEFIHPKERDAARAAYEAMAGGVIDGYQVQRRFVRPDGVEPVVNVSGRRVKDAGNVLGLWVLIPEPGVLPSQLGTPAPVPALIMGASSVVLAVTDHDWQIEYLSSDAQLLGARGAELRGFPLLGLVHPSAASEFMAAAARAAVDHLAVTVLTKLRAGHDRWADRYCLILAMCEHQPPRLGVVISAGPAATAPGASANPLDEYVSHAALESRALQTLGTLPGLAGLPHGNELSARQTEIVARLVAGERTPAIARSLFLSPSTVRNHLAAIYRKFGVHSQSQLLAALLRSVASHDCRGQQS